MVYAWLFLVPLPLWAATVWAAEPPRNEERGITMVECGQFTTGSCRGYIPVARQGMEGDLMAIPESLAGLRGNRRWAMEHLMACGATHYTVAWFQGVPRKGYSNSYCYRVYYGYRAG